MFKTEVHEECVDSAIRGERNAVFQTLHFKIQCQCGNVYEACVCVGFSL